MGKHRKVKTVQMGNKLIILDGVSPLRYVDLTTNKVVQYKPMKWDQYYKISYKVSGEVKE